MPCSGDQDLWFTYQPYEVSVAICPQFCSNLFSKCASATLISNNATVANSFSSDEFCYRILNPTFHVNMQNTGNCFDDLRPCTESDYFGLYSVCVNDKRNAYFFKKQDSMCSGGVALPNPVIGVACGMKKKKNSCWDIIFNF